MPPMTCPIRKADRKSLRKSLDISVVTWGRRSFSNVVAFCVIGLLWQSATAQSVNGQMVSGPAGRSALISQASQHAPASAPQLASSGTVGSQLVSQPSSSVTKTPNAPTLGASSTTLVVEKGPIWVGEEGHVSFKDLLTGTSVIVALLALTFSAYTRWRTANQAYYAHLSKIWYDLRKEEIKRPDWLDPSHTSMYGLRNMEGWPSAYDAHAWSCWAIIEDWYETYGRPRSFHCISRASWFKDLFPNELAQFEGTVRSVVELHWAWLQRAEHLQRFDARFVTWVRDHFVEARSEKLKESTVINAGAGLCARENLCRGQFIGYLSGERVPTRTLHTLQVGCDIHLLLDEPMRFLNHSSTPNAVVRGRSLFAYEDIPSGGEIFIDYACTEEVFSLEDDVNRGYGALSAQERQAREDRLHIWLLTSQATQRPTARR